MHVEIGQAVVVDVINGDVGALAGRHLRGVDPGNPAAEDRDLGGGDTGDAAEQHPAAALFLFEVMGADLDRHPPRDFAHRFQQRQRPRPRRHGLVGDAGRARLHQPFGLRLVRGEVKVGEQQMPRLEHCDLDRLGFLHLHDHVAVREHVGGGRQDLGTDGFIGRIREIYPHPGVRLDIDHMPRGDQFADRRRGQPDAIFVILDFLRHTDAHVDRSKLGLSAPIDAAAADCSVFLPVLGHRSARSWRTRAFHR